MGTLDSRWFDVAAFSALAAVLTIVFGKFEQHKPAWRRLAKLGALLALLLVLIEMAGRAWACGVIGLLLAAGAGLHFVLMSRAGINGFTGEPRDRFDAVLKEIEVRGEAMALLDLIRSTVSASSSDSRP